MMELAYKAYDAQGGLVQGVTHGETEREILDSFRKKGLSIVKLSTNVATEGILDSFKERFQKVSLEEQIVFTRQFYTLFKAGLGIDVLLTTLAKQTQNKALKKALTAIRDDVQNGSSLGKAFGKHPKIFNNLYVSMLVAGEEAGILEQVLSELSLVLEKECQLHREISTAILYPKIVVFVMLISLYVMITFIIPKFSSFYDKFDASLPLPTRILVGMGNFSSHYWYLVLGSIVLSTILIRRYLRTPLGRLRWDGLKLRLPIFGDLYQKISMARFGHLFAALYRSGLSLVKTFEVLANVIGNESYAVQIKGFREGILKGKTIAEVMRSSQNFCTIMVEATAIGEQSGNLDQMLSAMASHFDLEISHITKNLTTLLEPMLLTMMFGMVTLMALGIFLPMWNLSKVVMK